MKIDKDNMKEAKDAAKEILNKTEDKVDGIIQAIDTLNNAKYAGLIEEIQEQATKAESDKSYAKKLGLRALSKEEKNFYDQLKDIKNAVTGKQINMIPTSIIDLTLENIRQESTILEDINFAPADVKNWIIGEKTGTFGWGELSEALTKELTAEIDGLITDVNKLYAVLVIPKGIRELSYEFIDKYFMAILQEALNDGLEYGYFQGNGKKQPIGIYKQINSVNEDGTHKDKTVNKNLVNFTPRGLANAKEYLTNDGKRTLTELVIYCNPSDKANYVDPAIYNDRGELISSLKNLKVKDSAQNPQGKAALAIPKKYVMGLTNFGINEYKETKALDDADVLIGKGYANGRAVDDKIAFVFDVTKLEEYIDKVKVTAIEGTVNTKSEGVAGA